MVLQNRRISIAELTARSKLSRGIVGKILHDRLGLSKGRRVGCRKRFSPFERQLRVAHWKEVLELFENSEEDFLRRIVTGDEMWLCHYDPESEQQSRQWKHVNSPRPKRARLEPRLGKILATIFWDAEGILLIDYMEDGAAAARQRSSSQGKGGARCHSAVWFGQIDHPPYSPDLAPSDYFLFGNLKQHLRGTVFSDDNELKSAVQDYFNSRDKNFFFNGLMDLKSRCEKCIEVEGQYI
ncbi:hypothetical protein M513_12748 [Trichuris suis]|uniref:Mariner Mos1 transposase n=1 Tax=Trichuris suis TaxID=68888 RepID=A0A085LN31_9BILA|nr:hypothetical protein M513_12748 [Trichuris suis]